MFPLGSLPLSAIASMGGNDPRSLIKLAQQNPALVSGIAGQIARNPKMATDLATKMAGKAKMPKAPKVDMGYLMRQEQRIPMLRSRALEVASKSGVTPMLGKF
jgi:hypothetical protein